MLSFRDRLYNLEECSKEKARSMNINLLPKSQKDQTVRVWSHKRATSGNEGCATRASPPNHRARES